MHRKFEGILSIILGIGGLILWLIPTVGICVSILGLLLGMRAYGSLSKHLGVSGIIINVIALILTVIRSGLIALLT